jgi:uncharacterized membrane protein (UPF0127 family)
VLRLGPVAGRILLAIALFLLAGRADAFADGQPQLKTETVLVKTAKGTAAFRAEIADTAEARATGLMFRDSMPADHGMLFDFGEVRRVSMWMKNTRISLDMVFADSKGRVVGIAENTVPLSTNTISVNEPVRAVFEVNAGTAKRIGLKRGGHLIHPLFAKE